MPFISSKRQLFFILFFNCFAILNLHAQQTATYYEPEKDYKLALELFDKQKYAAAQQKFDEFIEHGSPLLGRGVRGEAEESRSNARFYAAVCAAELFNGDAEYRLTSFINDYSESPRHQSAVFALGKLEYRQKHYKKAIEWFEKVDPTLLTSDEGIEYHFKLGYSYYNTNNLDKAATEFGFVRNTDSHYATAAEYYCAHIAYMKKNYETALQGFLKLKDSESFGSIVPYYIIQIYYLQGRYDKVLEMAPSVIDSGNAKNGMEITRIVAESYYRTGDFKEAAPYLEDYIKNSPNASRNDRYMLGYCYYKAGEWDKAIVHFQKVTSKEDSMAQNAWYHLGDCYIKTDKKPSARNAFQSASQMKFDAGIREDALFNYAKLSYELNYQSVAIKTFRDYINDFPQSERVDAANEYLAEIFLSTKNYKDAQATIESIKVKTTRIKTAYQKVTYYRAAELFEDNKLDEALVLFDVSLANNLDGKFAAQADYWKGETYYKRKQYDDAIKAYNDFIYTPAAVNMNIYNVANYNIGYSYFKEEDYKNALVWFRKYIKEKNQTDTKRYNDALLRIADAFFKTQDIVNAKDYYDQAIQNKAASSDYAIFQKGVILGLEKKLPEKIATLQKIFDKYPKSSYYDDALYESGNAHFLQGDNDQALAMFKKLETDYPSSSYSAKALLGQGLTDHNSKKDEEAIAAFKKLIDKYPSSAESKEAMAQLKNIYVDRNQPDEYIKLNPKASGGEKDSTTYEATENIFASNDCQKSVLAADNYLQEFPSGIFVLNVHYYRAGCQYQLKNYEQALTDYNFVLSLSKNKFTEDALLKSAGIYYWQKDYSKAYDAYLKLSETAEVKDNITTAQIGMMRSAFRLKDYDIAIANAKKVLEGEGNDAGLVNEAHYIIAKSAFAKEDLNTAKTDFKYVADHGNGEITAESHYYLALIEYKLTNYKLSEKLARQIETLKPSYDYWVAKGYILIGDNLLALKDTFQAKATYKSIIDSYTKTPDDPDDLKAIAQEKYDAIATQENKLDKEMIDQKKKLVPQEEDSIPNKN